jgi:peptide/nickel transport system permease protein
MTTQHPTVTAAPPEPGARPRVTLWRRFRRNRVGVVGLTLLSALIAAALLAPLLAPHDPFKSIPNAAGRIERLQSPSPRHWLGTDHLGRDVFSRILYGAQVSLAVGFAATLITVGFGVLVGSIAGYFGGRVDAILMRITDVVLAFPILVLLIALAAVTRPTLWGVMVTIGMVFWTRSARIVRGEFLRLRETLFVQAAVASGATAPRIITKHILVNAISPIVVDATLRVAYAILLEATLSFIGVGLQEPTPSWGRMLNAASSLSILDGKPWLWLAPGLAIVVTTLSINFVGDALRDAIDPKLRPAR